MTASQVATYQVMLCVGGVDDADVLYRPNRQGFAGALRTHWRETPGLLDATAQHGELLSP